jgi:hypothetical protein
LVDLYGGFETIAGRVSDIQITTSSSLNLTLTPDSGVLTLDAPHVHANKSFHTTNLVATQGENLELYSYGNMSLSLQGNDVVIPTGGMLDAVWMINTWLHISLYLSPLTSEHTHTLCVYIYVRD